MVPEACTYINTACSHGVLTYSSFTVHGMCLMFNISTDMTAIAGSFHFDIQLPERVEKEKEKADEGKRKELSEEEEEGEKKANSTTKKRKKKSKHTCDEEEEQAGPSSPLTPGRRKKPRKISFCK